jgi:hypothetical protein
MTASLAATCGVIALLAGMIAALGITAQRSRPRCRFPALAGPPACSRVGATIARWRHEGAAEPRPEAAGSAATGRVSARILPFPRQPVGGPALAPGQSRLAATWHGRRDRNGRWIGHLSWSSAPHPSGRTGTGHRGDHRHDPADLLQERTR